MAQRCEVCGGVGGGGGGTDAERRKKERRENAVDGRYGTVRVASERNVVGGTGIEGERRTGKKTEKEREMDGDDTEKGLCALGGLATRPINMTRRYHLQNGKRRNRYLDCAPARTTHARAVSAYSVVRKSRASDDGRHDAF